MNFLLRLRHWQLFSLFIGVPIVMQIFFFICIFTNAAPVLTLILWLLLAVFMIYMIFGWIWALGNQLFPKLPEQHGLILKKFRTFLLIPVFYLSVILLWVMISVASATAGDSNEMHPVFLIFVIPTHLLSMFSIFYSLYFVSKSLKMVELQRPVTFNDYAGEFFLIWFFPIGVWFIQPRINNIFRRTTSIIS